MRTLTLLSITALSAPAFAGWPADVTLSGMTSYQGVRQADAALLGADYGSLVQELGSVVANRAEVPAKTLGAFGFDLSIGTSFQFVEAIDRGTDISPWDRAHVDNDAAPWLFLPNLSVRKGLPLSLEVGANMSWLGLSRTGTFGGFGRWAPLEGYKPWPDIAFQVGYSGLVGNDELDVGVLDLGVTIGSSWALRSALVDMNNGQFAPWINLSTLSIRANPKVDDATLAAIGGVAYRRNDADALAPINLLRIATGFQITTGNVHVRLSGSWVPKTIPGANVGMGFSF